MGLAKKDVCVSEQEVVIGSLLESSRILSRVRDGHVGGGVRPLLDYACARYCAHSTLIYLCGEWSFERGVVMDRITSWKRVVVGVGSVGVGLIAIDVERVGLLVLLLWTECQELSIIGLVSCCLKYWMSEVCGVVVWIVMTVSKLGIKRNSKIVHRF